MTVVAQILLGWLGLAVLTTLVWVNQRRTGNAGIVDVAWTFGLGGLAIFYAATSPGSLTARLSVALIAGLWSLRLGSYLARRVIGHPEDGRYRQLREQWGPHAQRNLFLFFQLQAMFSIVLGVSFQIVAWNSGLAPGGWALAGLVVAAVSIGGEALADRQLARFKADPTSRGKTCRSGLWRYSRHPNYFFEWLHWWAYVPLAVGATFGFVTLLAPFIMLYLLFRVTGIPATEAQALRSRGDDYRDYQRETSAFFPWFTRVGMSR